MLNPYTEPIGKVAIWNTSEFKNIDFCSVTVNASDKIENAS